MDFMINADIVVLVWLTLNSDFILGKQQCVHICDNQAWTSIVDSNLYFWLFLFWISTLTSIFTLYRHFVIFSWYSFVFCDMNLGVYKVYEVSYVHGFKWNTSVLINSTVYSQAHTHTCLMALCPVLPGWAGTRKVKPIWILLKQETVSGSAISWAICKSAPCSRQITTPAPHHSDFYRPDALPATQPTASKHWAYSQKLLQRNCRDLLS